MAHSDSLTILTGGTRGLGLATARRLAAEDIPTIITGTDPSHAADVAQQVGVRWQGLDLADVRSVDRFAEQLAALGRPSCLIANAGLQVTQPAATDDGIELTFAVNHLGHLQLVERLRDLDAMPERIVMLTSGTHDPARRTFMPHPLPVDVSRLRVPPEEAGTECLRRYTTAKLAVLMTAYELARRYTDTNVVAFDPGLMPGTGLARDHGAVARIAWTTVARVFTAFPFASSPAATARHLARLARGLVQYPSGTHVDRGRATRSSAASYDEDVQRQLVDDSMSLINELRGAHRR
jgi:NAD(P)-dependent dehydrogenase (short-subunit alcohol dehydrogenase family)